MNTSTFRDYEELSEKEKEIFWEKAELIKKESWLRHKLDMEKNHRELYKSMGLDSNLWRDCLSNPSDY